MQVDMLTLHIAILIWCELLLPVTRLFLFCGQIRLKNLLLYSVGNKTGPADTEQ